VAVLLAICSIAVLIFFIHHVPSKIHINSVIEDIGNRLLHEVGQRFPRCVGKPADVVPDPDDPILPPALRRGVGRSEAAQRRL
ncbi:DUF2254 domain-containing protein, partial [Klebsiella pneumoniae]|nr:DUF2254 domain-containing protein [Klebsiella pneumoniae]